MSSAGAGTAPQQAAAAGGGGQEGTGTRGKTGRRHHRRGRGRKSKGKKEGDAAGAAATSLSSSSSGWKKERDQFEQAVRVRLRRWKDRAAPFSPEEGLQHSPFPAEGEVGAACEEVFVAQADHEDLHFPVCLSAAQRRCVHQVALDLQLFHTSVGEEPHRFVAVCRDGAFTSLGATGDVDLTTAEQTGVSAGAAAGAAGAGADENATLSGGQRRPGMRSTARVSPFHDPTVAKPRGLRPRVLHMQPADQLKLDDLLDKIKRRRENGNSSMGVAPFVPLEQHEQLCSLRQWPHVSQTPAILVDTEASLRGLIAELESLAEFAFDVESHSFRSYHGLTCAVQISTGTCDYVIDVFRVWDAMNLLAPVFSDPCIVKVAHAISGCDVPALFRDFAIVMDNVFDTQIGAGVVHGAGAKNLGLLKLLQMYGLPEEDTERFTDLKGRMQTSDWRRRPFTHDMVTYSRADAHYLLPVYRMLKRELLTGNRIDVDGPDGDGGAERKARNGASSTSNGPGGKGTSATGGACASASGLGASDNITADGVQLAGIARPPPSAIPDHLPAITESVSREVSAEVGADHPQLGANDSNMAQRQEEDGDDLGGEDTDFGMEEDQNGDFLVGDDDDDDDDDDDMWAGWGEDTTTAGAMAAAAAPTVDEKEAETGAGEKTEADDGATDTDASGEENTPRSGRRHRVRENSFSGHIFQPEAHWPSDARMQQPGTGDFDLATQRMSEIEATPAGLRDYMRVIEQSRRLCMRLWKPKKITDKSWMHVHQYNKAKKNLLGWNHIHTEAFRALFYWRERTAEQCDESPHFVASADMLIRIAYKLPTTLQDLKLIAFPISEFVNDPYGRHAKEIVQTTRAAIATAEAQKAAEAAKKEAAAAERQREKESQAEVVKLNAVKNWSLALLGLAAAAAGVGWFLWLRQRRHRV